ncbi:N-acetylmuramoyl-L-alanine amidase [Streptomyces sp. CB00455]|uniref:peptidoglycan recognition protein family protein n=1 Tax=Streptomyces sp. CB00455 TaxID=1703927 RepID=UPI00093AA901|nr:peptidoglycan recognition family protein [Streptomyces sp. CB00455]OKK22086.1 N-acetylmuramoyl-L-alanine amidase [Streptomyces sp. CB00455]
MCARPLAPQTAGAPGGLARRTLLAGALGVGAALWPATGALALPASGRATVEVLSCEEWGARPPSESVVVLSTAPERIIVHHTATANVEDYSKQRAFALARAIQNYHMDTQGWIDTGQHFTVSRGAYVTEGRHRSLAELTGGARQVRAAHCVGQNNVAVGIENEGTYTSVEPPARQYEALVALCAQICHQYGLPASEIHGHRDFNQTSCPGDRLYALLPRLRQDVAARLGVELGQHVDHDTGDRWTGPAEYLPSDVLERELARWGRPGPGR